MMAGLDDDLIDLYREAGVESSISFWDTPEDIAVATKSLVDAFTEACGSYARRFADRSPAPRPMNIDELRSLGKENPHKLRAFLQALDAAYSPEMLVMAWRLVLDDQIQFIDLKYDARKEFRFVVVLQDPVDGWVQPTYETSHVEDVALLRHVGIIRMDGDALLDGFYALTR